MADDEEWKNKYQELKQRYDELHAVHEEAEEYERELEETNKMLEKTEEELRERLKETQVEVEILSSAASQASDYQSKMERMALTLDKARESQDASVRQAGQELDNLQQQLQKLDKEKGGIAAMLRQTEQHNDNLERRNREFEQLWKDYEERHRIAEERATILETDLETALEKAALNARTLKDSEDVLTVDSSVHARRESIAAKAQSFLSSPDRRRQTIDGFSGITSTHDVQIGDDTPMKPIDDVDENERTLSLQEASLLPPPPLQQALPSAPPKGEQNISNTKEMDPRSVCLDAKGSLRACSSSKSCIIC